MAKNTKALVTLNIGEKYKNMWRDSFADTWFKYAEKHGYDVVSIEDYIDRSAFGYARSPHWQKCLILEDAETQDYEYVVWIDSDIMINYHTAPCIVAANERDNDESKVGAVTWQGSERPNPERFENGIKRVWNGNQAAWVRALENPTFQKFFELGGYPMDRDDTMNTGVLVLKPDKHRDVLRHVYETYQENPHTSKEQMALCHYLLSNDLVNPIDSRFNKIWDTVMIESYPFLSMPALTADTRMSALCVNTAYHNSYFLHFLSGPSRAFVGLVVKDLNWIDSWKAIYHHFQERAEAAA